MKQKSPTETAAVILAAGKGVRMKSQLPKVLHPILGKSMVSYVIDACRKAGAEKIILVVGHQSRRVREVIGDTVEYVEQAQQLGTGHALLMAADRLKTFKGNLLVVAGDTPLLSGSVLRSLVKAHQKSDNAATMMTACLDPTPPYGRIVRNEEKLVLRIVEEWDASPSEKKINEVNTSHYCFHAGTVLPLLSEIGLDNDQKEYYLTDIVEILANHNKQIATRSIKDHDVLLGINSRQDLARITRILQTKICEDWMDRGVTLLDSGSTTIEPDVRIGQDTVIHPYTTLSGKTVIGTNCTIGPQTLLKDAKIGNNSRVEYSVVENCSIEKEAVIGPFASIQKFE